MFVEALVNLLEFLLVLHLLTERTGLLAVSLLVGPLPATTDLGLAGLLRRRVVGIGVLFLQVLQHLYEDCLYLRVLVQEGIAIP